MSWLAAAATALSGGAAYLTGRKNVKSQNEQNYRDRQQQWDMYNTQRDDAIEDWHRQNAYDNPKQMMERLREAGLNPHLMLSGGAQSTGSMVRSSQSNPSNQPAAKMNEGILPQLINDIFTNVNQLYQGREIQAQTDNLYAQNALIQSQTQKYILEGENVKYDLDMKHQLRDDIAEGAKLANLKTRADIDFTLDSNQRAQLSNTSDIAKTTQEIIESKMRVLQMELQGAKTVYEQEKIKREIDNLAATAQNLKNTDLMQKLQNDMEAKKLEMLKNGINPNSPTWQITMYELWRKILGL